MYFSEQGNVDDDATLITIFWVSFNLQSCCLMQSAVSGLQSAVCKCHTPTLEGLGEFETVMQTRDEVSKHRKKVFYCFYKITFPRKKGKPSCLEH